MSLENALSWCQGPGRPQTSRTKSTLQDLFESIKRVGCRAFVSVASVSLTGGNLVRAPPETICSFIVGVQLCFTLFHFALKRFQHRPLRNICSLGRVKLQFVAVGFHYCVCEAALVYSGSRNMDTLSDRREDPQRFHITAAWKNMVLIVGKGPIKSAQVVRVSRCVLGCGFTSMKGHDLITLLL